MSSVDGTTTLLTNLPSPDFPLPSIETLLETTMLETSAPHETEDPVARFGLLEKMQAAHESARRAEARETIARRARANTEPPAWTAMDSTYITDTERQFGPASDLL